MAPLAIVEGAEIISFSLESLRIKLKMYHVPCTMYHGESSRTLYTRAQQHRDDYVSNYSSNGEPKGSWMWDHVLKEHGGLPGPVASEDFTFRLVGTFRDCLGRQTDETVRLELTELLGYVLRTGSRWKDSGDPDQEGRIFPAQNCATSFPPAVTITLCLQRDSRDQLNVVL